MESKTYACSLKLNGWKNLYNNLKFKAYFHHKTIDLMTLLTLWVDLVHRDWIDLEVAKLGEIPRTKKTHFIDRN